jgi:protein SCO1/2
MPDIDRVDSSSRAAELTPELYRASRPSYIGGVYRYSALALIVIVLSACSNAQEYPLTGQVLAVDTTQQVITVKHQDIVGFMPGMTMPFKVKAARELEGKKPGDLITATLVVDDSVGYLAGITKTGEAPLPPAGEPAPRVTMIEPGTEVPDTALIDQQGRARRISEWRGKTIAVTFVYTRCPLPDFCPRMDRHFKAAQAALQSDPALAARAHLLSVSFDPDYDTPAIMAAHAQRVGADPAIWSYLTGERESVDRFAGAFGVAEMREDQPMQEIVHNLRTAVIDANGRLVTVLNGRDWTPDELVSAIRVADGQR